MFDLGDHPWSFSFILLSYYPIIILISYYFIVHWDLKIPQILREEVNNRNLNSHRWHAYRGGDKVYPL